MGLSLHVLDTAQGCPGAGMEFELAWLGAGERHVVRSGVTNRDGRTDAWLLSQEELRIGPYEMLFQVGAYFRAAGFDLPDPPFIEEVCLRFSVADTAAHYHVPLLCSPYGYTTYRGS